MGARTPTAPSTGATAGANTEADTSDIVTMACTSSMDDRAATGLATPS